MKSSKTKKKTKKVVNEELVDENPNTRYIKIIVKCLNDNINNNHNLDDHLTNENIAMRYLDIEEYDECEVIQQKSELICTKDNVSEFEMKVNVSLDWCIGLISKPLIINGTEEFIKENHNHKEKSNKSKKKQSKKHKSNESRQLETIEYSLTSFLFGQNRLFNEFSTCSPTNDIDGNNSITNDWNTQRYSIIVEINKTIPENILKELLPIKLNIKGIYSLPANLNNIQKLCVRYLFMVNDSFKEFISPLYSVKSDSQDINIEFEQIFLLGLQDMSQFYSLIQNNSFCIELLSRKSLEDWSLINTSSIIEHDENDEKQRKKKKKKKKKSKNNKEEIEDLEDKSLNIFVPNKWEQSTNMYLAISRFSLNDLFLGSKYIEMEEPLIGSSNNRSFIDNDSYMTLQWRLGHLLPTMSLNKGYSHFVSIIPYSNERIREFLDTVETINAKTMNIEHKTLLGKSLQQKDYETYDLISTVHICDGNIHIMIVEGVKDSESFNSIINCAHNLGTDAHILWNSNYSYTSCFYFFTTCIRHIRLRSTFDELQQSDQLYISKDVNSEERVAIDAFLKVNEYLKYMQYVYDNLSSGNITVSPPTLNELNLIERYFGAYVSDFDLGFFESSENISGLYAPKVLDLFQNEV